MRPLGDSGLAVAPLALGGNVFGWTAEAETSFRILDAFVDAGGTMIDTADVYSAWVPGHMGGESENVIGEWLKRDPTKRERVVIATKVGFFEGLAPDKIHAACDASLKRLRIETIDLYYQHKDDEGVPLVDSLGAFDALRKAGKIRATGLSNFPAERVGEALKLCRAEGFERPAALQNWYNLVERRKYEGALQDVTVAEGLSQCPYYGLANGYLTGKYRSKADLEKSPRGLRNVEYIDSARGKSVLAALDKISSETGVALATIALAWLKAQPGITAPIASATSLDQLNELVAVLRFDLTAEQIAALNAASD